jgi:(p)ppGpp synthase/HD superfamily hydrolase
MNLERAIAIATEAHAGQTDKAGAPYTSVTFVTRDQQLCIITMLKT